MKRTKKLKQFESKEKQRERERENKERKCSQDNKVSECSWYVMWRNCQFVATADKNMTLISQILNNSPEKQAEMLLLKIFSLLHEKFNLFIL